MAVIKHLDGLGASAQVIGAVNGVVIRDGHMIGENTDGQGFLAALRPVVEPAGKRVVLFGAGGAARAVAFAGAAITMVNRNRKAGVELAGLLAEKTPARAEFVAWDGTYRVPEATAIVANATSIGLFPHVDQTLDLDPASLRPTMVVADVIPKTPRTWLLRTTAERGCNVLDGLGMLVNQGVISIRHWLDVEVDAIVMRRKLEAIFGV